MARHAALAPIGAAGAARDSAVALPACRLRPNPSLGAGRARCALPVRERHWSIHTREQGGEAAASTRQAPMRHAVALVAAILVGGCAAVPLSSTTPVEIPTLLADPGTYDGQLVRVTGAAVVRFEAQFICPGVEQFDAATVKQCLWLREGVDEGYGPERMAGLHGKQLVLTGRFKGFEFGHGAAYGGSIVPIEVRVVGTHGEGDIPPPPPEQRARGASARMSAPGEGEGDGK